MRAERLTDVVTHHGEGAGWHPDERAFRCVDMLAGDVLTLTDDGAVADRLHVDSVAAAWRPRAAGGIVVGVERGFALVDRDGSVRWQVEAWPDPAVRMNDGACDPQGRFYCGSMGYDAGVGAGVLWRLDPDRSVHLVLDGLTIPNGLVWSLDGSTAYHVDTPTGRIDRLDFDAETGLLGERRPVAEVRGGAPDGMTIDAEGGLWVALWGGRAVHRYDTAGALTEVVDVAASQVSSCAFGGPRLDRLYITTSREGLADHEDPDAGAVFVAEPGVVGVPLLAYGG